MRPNCKIINQKPLRRGTSSSQTIPLQIPTKRRARNSRTPHHLPIHIRRQPQRRRQRKHHLVPSARRNHRRLNLRIFKPHHIAHAIRRKLHIHINLKQRAFCRAQRQQMPIALKLTRLRPKRNRTARRVKHIQIRQRHIRRHIIKIRTRTRRISRLPRTAQLRRQHNLRHLRRLRPRNVITLHQRWKRDLLLHPLLLHRRRPKHLKWLPRPRRIHTIYNRRQFIRCRRPVIIQIRIVIIPRLVQIQ